MAKTADAFCDNSGFLGDGTVQITVSEEGNPANLADYSITWYRGNSTAAADEIFPNEGTPGIRGQAGDISAGTDLTALDSLASGDYTVVVTKNPATSPNAGCSVTSVFAITIDQPTLTIAQADVNRQDNQNCVNPNGYVTVTAVSEDGNNAAFPLSDYTFTWFKDGAPFVDGTDGTLSDSLGATGNSIIELDSGNYTVTAENAITGCTTNATFSIGLDDIGVNPLLSLESAVGSNYCDVIDDSRGSNFQIGDGALAIDISHGTDVIDNPDGSNIGNTDYLIEWYINLANPAINPGNGDPQFLFDNLGNFNADLEFLGTSQPDTIGGNPDFTRLDSLRAGTYTVFVTKLTSATNPNDIYLGCGSSASYVVKDNSLSPEQIVVSQPLTDTPFTIGTGKNDNNNCNPRLQNGYIEITEVVELSTRFTGTQLDNYQFDWFRADGSPFVDLDVDPLIDDGDIVDGTNGVNTRVDSLSAGTYQVMVTNLTTGCVSDMIAITIGDASEEPVIDPVPGLKVANSLCEADPTLGIGNGELAVTYRENPSFTLAEYEVRWYRGQSVDPSRLLFSNQGETATAIVGDALINGSFNTLTGLSTGFYTVEISKTATGATSPHLGCSTVRTYEITEDLSFPNVNIPESQVVHNTLCASAENVLGLGNGSIRITAANINIPTGSSMSDFNWTITPQTTAGSPATFNPGTEPILLEGLVADVYEIVATRISTGCESAAIEVEILDESIDPNLAEVIIAPDLSCITNKDNFVDGGTGAISLVNVDVDGTGDNLIDLPNSRYTISWYIGSGTSRQPISSNTNIVLVTADSIVGLSEGIYEVDVYDTQTFCTSTQQIEVFREEEAPFITNTEVNNNTFCAPKSNGSIVILEISYNGVVLDLNPIFTEDALGNVTDTSYFDDNDQKYQVEWFDSDRTTSIVDPEPGTPFELEGLSANGAADGKTYYASIQQVDNQCASELVEFTIFDNPFTPEILITTLQADSTCSPSGFPNGQVFATSSGQNGDDSTLVFNWYNSTDLNTIIAIDDTLSNVPAGTYVVEVIDSFTGCDATAEVTIENKPPVTEIIDFVITDPTTCDPPNGTVEVLSVTTGNLERMVFDIYNENPGRPITANPAPILTLDTAVMVFGDRDTQYFIVGRDTLTGCLTAPIEVNFGDQTPNVVLEQTGFTFQTNCDPARANGTITVAANGVQDTSLFRFEWFDENGILIESNNPTADSLAAGLYTARVTDLSSGCTFELELPMADDLDNPFPISATTTANFNCINPNGRMSVNVVNARKPLFIYRYLWKIGADQTPTESDFDYEGQLVENVPAGVYSVVVIDTDDRFCTSEPINVTVEDATTPPVFFLTQVEPLTNCDPERPNAIAEAGVPGDDLFRYSFEWFVGTDTAGVAPIARGITVDSLAAITYGVVATDALTGCRSLQTITIEDATVPPPAPDVTIANDRTNCLVPNGTAFASVGGDILAYDFTWYSFADPDSVLGTGPSIATLDIGDYFVTTTDKATGCVSGATPLAIMDARVEPEFTVETRLSLCARDANNLDEYNHNGEGRIVFTNANFIEIDSIVWYFDANEDGIFEINPGPTERQDQQLSTGAPGRHKVWIRDGNGCDYEQEFTIGTEIVVYNGVSDNGDGLNDIFLIDCLDYFPNNNVKIYNRAGVLIYEMDNYDNFSNFFNGYGNRGGANGNQQAEGTYFYIIDKGDGSDLLQGYLELTR